MYISMSLFYSHLLEGMEVLSMCNTFWICKNANAESVTLNKPKLG